MKIKTHSAQQTRSFAQAIGEKAYSGLTLLLSGDLGAGKTTFTQGLAIGLKIDKTVSSPTFTIMKNYHGTFDLNHIDAYRLEGLHQDLGFEEMIGKEGISVIEWPDFIKEVWPNEYLKIEFTYIDEYTRELELVASGEKEEALLRSLE